jgi:hypothetical protein
MSVSEVERVAAEAIRQETYRLRRANGSNIVCPLSYAEHYSRAVAAALPSYEGMREALESAAKALNRIAMIADEGSAVRLQAEAELGAIDQALASIEGPA